VETQYEDQDQDEYMQNNDEIQKMMQEIKRMKITIANKYPNMFIGVFNKMEQSIYQ